jgi:DNA polymerase III delta prime subunit
LKTASLASAIFSKEKSPIAALTTIGRRRRYNSVDSIASSHHVDQLKIKEQVTEIRKLSGLKAFERKREVSRLILSDLKQQGTFYRTSTRVLYFFAHATKTLLRTNDVDFARFITDAYGLNRSEQEFDYLLEELATEAHMRGTLTETRQFAYYNRDSGVLYVSNNQNQIYRLDGENIALVDNGTDGVLFLPDPMTEPFSYLGPESSEKSLLHRLLLDRVNFSVYPHSLLTREDYRLLLYLYLLALVFESLHPTKPLALFTGPKGAGKTWTLRAVGRWLFGSHFDVTTLAKDKEDAFITTICARSFVAYDNVDSKIAWLNDRLATAATGQRIELRKLYTTLESAVFTSHCFIALTSRTPEFKRDDVVDRLLLFQVERLSQFQSEVDLLAEIRRNRDALWTEYLNDLNVVVAGLREQTTQLSTSHRMADFATFAQRVGSVLGREDEVVAIFDKLGKDQSAFLLEEDPIAQALAAWLENPVNLDSPIASGDLFTALAETAQSQGTIFPFKSAVAFGQRLKHLTSNLEDNLSLVIHVEKGHARKTIYTFSRKHSSGESCPDLPSPSSPISEKPKENNDFTW